MSAIASADRVQPLRNKPVPLSPLWPELALVDPELAAVGYVWSVSRRTKQQATAAIVRARLVVG